MDKKVWLSRRALKLHAVILFVVPAFLALCLWQISRALGGNSLSWAYVFEWPFFAAYAIYMWWRFVQRRPRPTARHRRDRSGGRASGSGPRRCREDPKSRKRTPSSPPTTRTWPSWRNRTGPPGADSCSGGGLEPPTSDSAPGKSRVFRSPCLERH